MRRTILWAASAAIALGGCGSPAPESASGTPDAADNAVAEAPASPAAPEHADPPAKDVQVPAIADGTEVTVSAAGYGKVKFGMTRSEVEQAAGGAFAPASGSGGCQATHAQAQPDVTYVFEGGKLQRIDVSTPTVVAEGGGRMGMDADEIRTLYGGKLSEKPRADVKTGHSLQVAASKDSGIAFLADEGGKVEAFRAGGALDAAAGCGG